MDISETFEYIVDSMDGKNSSHSTVDDFVKLSVFADIAKAIGVAKTREEVYASVMKQVTKIFSPSNWSLLLYDKENNELVFEFLVGQATSKLKGHRIPVDQGIAGWIFSHKQSVIVDDVSKDSRFNNAMDGVSEFKTKSIIGVPLIVNEEAIGVIELVNKCSKEKFSILDMRILSTIADLAAIGVERALYIETIRQMSLQDALTGTGNRRQLDWILKKEVERAVRYNQALALMILDIDDFKNINDTYGHKVGDEVLKALASILEQSVRGVDTVARFGGDEFAVVMPATDEATGTTVAKRIIRKVQASSVSSEEVFFSVSIGIKSSRGAGVKDLFEDVDTLMYQAKAAKDSKSSNRLPENHS